MFSFNCLNECYFFIGSAKLKRYLVKPNSFFQKEKIYLEKEKWFSGKEKWFSGKLKWFLGKLKWFSGKVKWFSGKEKCFSGKIKWFSGKTEIRTYNINELLGTKLRALYQRSKGRDLFDLHYSRLNMELNTDEIIRCFKEYIIFATGNRPPSKKEFLLSIEEKENNPDFTGDMEALLRPEIEYNQEVAFEWLKKELIEKI